MKFKFYSINFSPSSPARTSLFCAPRPEKSEIVLPKLDRGSKQANKQAKEIDSDYYFVLLSARGEWLHLKFKTKCHQAHNPEKQSAKS